MTRHDKIEWIRENVTRKAVNIALKSMPEQDTMVQALMEQLMMTQYMKAFDATKDMYTDEDLEGVIAFFKTDAGVKYFEVTEKMTMMIGGKITDVVEATNTISNALKES